MNLAIQPGMRVFLSLLACLWTGMALAAPPPPPDDDEDLDMLEPPPPPPPDRDGKGPRRGGPMAIFKNLDLSAEQTAKLDSIREDMKSKMKSLHQDVKSQRESMHNLLKSGAAPEAIRQQHQKMRAAHQALEDLRFEAMIRGYEILTPEQRIKAGEHMEKMPPPGRPPRGFGGPKRP